MRIKSSALGFTLIETLLALGVFGLVFPALLQSVVLTATLNNSTSDLIYSNIVAENKIETLRSQGYNTLNLGTTNFTSEINDTLGEASAIYTISDAGIGLKSIELIVSYTDRGKLVSNSYITLISEIGVAQ